MTKPILSCIIIFAGSFLGYLLADLIITRNAKKNRDAKKIEL